MVFILSLIIIFILISVQTDEKGKLSKEDWTEGIRVILIMGGVLVLGLVIVYLLETYYFN